MFVAATCMFLSLLCTAVEGSEFSARELSILETVPPEGAIIKVYKTDNPEDMVILRTVCDKVSDSVAGTDELQRLMAGMLSTVRDPENTGVGIAAPQVGITKRIIAVQRFDREGEPFEFYLNPRIIEASEEMVESDEGCLSIPDGRGRVPRHKSIVIEYNHPEDFRLCRESVEGFTAIIFQHETDHLEGILFTDKTITNPNGEI